MWGAVSHKAEGRVRERLPAPRLAVWLPFAAGLFAVEPVSAQDPGRECWSAVRILAGMVADPPHDNLAVAHYTAAHRHLTRARTACTQGQADRAQREAERGIRRLQAPETR
jgi:hypothetical protein